MTFIDLIPSLKKALQVIGLSVGFNLSCWAVSVPAQGSGAAQGEALSYEVAPLTIPKRLRLGITRTLL